MSLKMDTSLWDVPRGYFNTALRGIPPRVSVEAAKRTLDLWSRGDLDWTAWLDELVGARREFAALIGVSADQVGVGHTTAALVNVVAANLRANSRVLLPEREHNSNTIPFIAQQYRGISVDTAPLAELAGRVSSDYAAVAVSLVQSLDGSIVDLASVSQACRRADALLCVDVTQAAGWLPFDATLADVLVCSSYKWLMGPNGPSFIVLRKDLVDSFRQLQPNWFACEDPHAAPYGIDFPASRSARKFDVVPGLISASALLPSLRLINDLGVRNMHRHNTQLAAALCRKLNVEHNGSAIVILHAAGATEKLKARDIRATVRGERIRAAIHAYNTADDIDLLVEALR
jgi:selenocysteine lyase/cysteine desulfurase